MSLRKFQILPFLKIFITDFSEPKKARKLKVHINMDNDWMCRVYQTSLYCVYQNKGQRSVTFGVMSLGRFSKKLKCILLNNFYVCGPTLMKHIPQFISKIRKVYWQNSGQGPITLWVMSLDRFSNFAILDTFCGLTLMKLIPQLVSEVRRV